MAPDQSQVIFVCEEGASTLGEPHKRRGLPGLCLMRGRGGPVVASSFVPVSSSMVVCRKSIKIRCGSHLGHQIMSGHQIPVVGPKAFPKTHKLFSVHKSSSCRLWECDRTSIAEVVSTSVSVSAGTRVNRSSVHPRPSFRSQYPDECQLTLRWDKKNV